MTTAAKKTPSEVKKAIIAGRTGDKKKKLTAIARELEMAYNTEFVPLCNEKLGDVFKELGEPLPKALGAKEGVSREMAKLRKVAPKAIVEAVIAAKGALTSKQLADKLGMGVGSFKKQYEELTAKGLKLPALPDGEISKDEIDDLNALLMDAK